MLAVIFINIPCFADVIKGAIEKVDLKTYEITVGGKVVNVSKATIFTVNDMGTTKNVIIRDIKDHRGETVVCYGSAGKDNIMDAYKVKVVEGHR